MENEKVLANYIDCIFTVYGEMIENNGEDCYMFSVDSDYGIIGVFDGCGGLGARKYAEYNHKSGAYIASFISAKTTLMWFEKICKKRIIFNSDECREICNDLKKDIVNELQKQTQGICSNGIKGSMVRSFPTTASVILFAIQNGLLYASFIWAGDSRGYILTPSGLTQITVDDIENKADAYVNISSDARLTNVVSAEGDFELNNQTDSFESPCVLITATDGCFGYFSTPMEFEYMLIDTLMKSIARKNGKIR